MGSFGGTYFRPIFSTVTNSTHKNAEKVYSDWRKVDGSPIGDNYLTNKWEDYDTSINRYKVSAGTTKEFWEEKGWITKYDPYGWF